MLYMPATIFCTRLRLSDRLRYDYVDGEWPDMLQCSRSTFAPILRDGRDVLGEVREAGVSERSGSPLRSPNLIGWLLTEVPY
jgi:hypothetical protein